MPYAYYNTPLVYITGLQGQPRNQNALQSKTSILYNIRIFLSSTNVLN